jgi:hypothetical protein
MAENTNKNKLLLDKLLSTYSIQDIISIFANIDDKIMSLHKSSSDDFLAYNAHLKKHYKQAKVISDNTTSIFDIVAGKDNRLVFNEFNLFHEKLKQLVEFLEQQINNSVTYLSRIMTNMNFMFVPLKNFSQNLTTLKFLVNNLKLNITSLAEIPLGKELDESVLKIDELIRKVKIDFPKVDKELAQLKSSIRSTLLKLNDINYRNTVNVETILSQIHTNITYLYEQYQQAFLQMPVLSQKTDQCFNNISKIITSLQYQDIIRQKMEHIQRTHQELIQELNLLDVSENEIVLFKQAKYVSQIPEIAELQIAQLIHTNKEYQTAIQVIINKFVEIAEDMGAITQLSQQIYNHTHGPKDSNLEQIKDKLNSVIEIIHQFSFSNLEFTNEIKKIHVAIEEMVRKLDLINVDYEELQEEIMNLLHKGNDSEHLFERTKIGSQLKTISADITANLVNCKVLFKSTYNLSLNLEAEVETYQKQNSIATDISLLSQNIESIIFNISEKNLLLSNILQENIEQSGNASVQIKTTIEEVKYYDFFEKVVEDIIIELHTIYSKLENEHPELIIDEKAESLKVIKTFYTTRSEHEVHDKLLQNKDIELFGKDVSLDDPTESNVELF